MLIVVEMTTSETPMRMPKTEEYVGICDLMAMKGSMNMLPNIRTIRALISERPPSCTIGPRIAIPALGLAANTARGTMVSEGTWKNWARKAASSEDK